ncbi:MAG: HAMP domain-containing histidine kinase [Gammaproteobacteria bacterium]|nr:HAMP domain-containing histidine kinase [Gammaproteobacteria bacterium]NND39395.1 HAMP domain-containing histidine kinase [Pseudomonadales bacterium]NNM10614.1 HAMP domain-containing histidine kinase [Pseudomonadales bacterium]RZV58156.1 MAG: HAMP domain-containing histidine kinase [Pseudomonadales bacterium]
MNAAATARQPKQSPDAGDAHQLPVDYDRPILIVYLCYRLGITALLWALSFTDSAIGQDYPQLFLGSALCYFSINALLLALVLRGWAPNRLALLLVVLSDIFLLQLIALASGPIDSGLGTLMVISVAAGAIFIRGALALVPPAIATLFLFAGVGARLFDEVARQNEIVASGWLGLSFFIASVAISYLARRMQQGEARALEEASSARKLEQLNQLIIARMQTGVMIVDAAGNVLACNRAAMRIVPEHIDPGKCSLADINSELANYHASVYKHFKSSEPAVSTRARFSTSVHADNNEFRLTWVSLDAENSDESLIFVEDLSKIVQQAQQLKLSSLGKLTASIAHEIRNPIGAASHAAQLLREASSGKDVELADMIVDHCNRCSKIISNIMDVSRGEPAREMLVDIADWLRRLVDRYQAENTVTVTLHCPDSVLTRFDPAHLEQVVRNLLDNAVNHASQGDAGKRAAIIVWLDDNCAIMDIYDTGSGVPADNIERLFEPFFTTGRSGSGLGLYICRELCTANQATLGYIAESNRLGAAALDDTFSPHCFRVRFAHPERQPLNLAGNAG